MITLILSLALGGNSLAERVTLPPGEVSLADLIPAEQGLSSSMLQQLDAIGLGRAPGHGKERRISGRYLRRLIRATGIRGIRVPEQVILVGASQTIDEAAQLRFIRDQLARQFGKTLKLEQVEALGSLKTLKVPPKSRLARARLAPGSRLAGRASVKLEIMTGRKLVKRLIVQVRLLGAARVHILNHALKRGQVLQPGDYDSGFRSLDLLPRTYRAGSFTKAGQVMRRHAQRGTVLTPSLLKAPTVVSRGDSVQLELRQSGMVMRTRGRALGQGAVGDAISVLNTSSGKRLRGRVKSAGLVEVSP